MKFDIKATLTFFIMLLLIGLIMEYFYSSSKGIAFNYPLSRIVIYALLSVVYGLWKGRSK
jgi:hypothetical protein